MQSREQGSDAGLIQFLVIYLCCTRKPAVKTAEMEERKLAG